MSFDPAILKTLSRNERPSEAQLRDALTSILSGEAASEQISALLLGLEMIGLSSRELRVGTEVMRANMRPVRVEADVIDIVGTGGTGLHTLSISTATALVSASAGAVVAKHGNRAASSLTGTADTLSELGLDLSISPERAGQIIGEVGIGFLFAPNHHPAMRHVGPARKALGIRTLFNMLGPMSNPAGAKRMLLGVCDDRWRKPMAEALNDLGAEHVWVVHGEDGLDEVTTTARTFVTEVKDGALRELTVTPDMFDIPKASLAELRGGAPADNANALTALLDGVAGPYRDIVRLNAGVALMLAGVVPSVEGGIELATRAIDDGAARDTLQRLRAATRA
ncbi:MAG: anthranilate phosphoribosyltransferase [Litorimonas sp.]